MNVKHATIITMIKIKEDHQTLYTVTFIVINKNATTKTVNFHITNSNSFIIQIVTKLNFVSFIPIISKIVITKTFAHLPIRRIKSSKISNWFIYLRKTMIFTSISTRLFGVRLRKSIFVDISVMKEINAPMHITFRILGETPKSIIMTP